MFIIRLTNFPICTELKSIEQLSGFDDRMKLKDIDLHKMGPSTSDPSEPISDGLLEENSLALFNEVENIETEGQNCSV